MDVDRLHIIQGHAYGVAVDDEYERWDSLAIEDAPPTSVVRGPVVSVRYEQGTRVVVLFVDTESLRIHVLEHIFRAMEWHDGKVAALYYLQCA